LVSWSGLAAFHRSRAPIGSGQLERSSHIEEDGWLVGELLLLNAHDWAVHRVVDVWQVSLSWSLSDSTELIVDGSVAKADPSLVGTKIWDWDATQMSANGGAHQDLGVTSVGEGGHGLLIQKGGVWKSVGGPNLGQGESSNEDDLSVPGGLEHLTWWKLGDIELLVGVSDVSSSGDHLVVDHGDDGLDTNHVGGDDEALEHVDLSSLDLVVSILLVPESVLVEPVVSLGLGVKRVSEVGWSGRSHPVCWSLGTEEVVNKLLVLSFVVLLNNTEASGLGAYNSKKFK
jgi:hypothetical protein